MAEHGVRDHFDEEAPVYDDVILRLIPGYLEQHDAVLAMLPFPTDAALRVLDLGSGTGALARLVLEAFPDAHVEAADFAPGMLAECAAALAGFEDRLTLRELDFATDELGSGYDAVVSGLAIHHLDDPGKRALFGRVLHALRPGGVFVVRDVVAGRTPEETDRFVEEWRAFMDASGADGAHYVELARREDMLAPLDDQLRWLREAGFADVRCTWTRINVAVFGGRRP